MSKVPLPSEKLWRQLAGLFDEYFSAQQALMDGESLARNFTFPAANELRNGLHDLIRVLASKDMRDHDVEPLLAEVKRHFRRARSEVFEAVLLTRLDVLSVILDSLRKDPQYRHAKAQHYPALQEAFDRGRVEGGRAREAKWNDPDAASKSAKTAIAIVDSTVAAFMMKAGDFELAEAVHGLQDGQEALSEGQVAIRRVGTAHFVVGIVLALAIFVAGMLLNQNFNRNTGGASDSSQSLSLDPPIPKQAP